MVGNKEYTVVGETETWCPIIPSRAFTDGYELTSITMYVGGMMTVERNRQIVDRFKEYFGADVEMQSPRKEDLIEEQVDNSIYAVIVAANVIISNINSRWMLYKPLEYLAEKRGYIFQSMMVILRRKRLTTMKIIMRTI